MSHIQSSRMPHVYESPDTAGGEQTGVGETLRKDFEKARGAVGSVSTGTWLMSLLGAGVLGAAAYAALGRSTPAPKRKASGRRRRTGQSAASA